MIVQIIGITYKKKIWYNTATNMSVSLLQCMSRLGPFRCCGYNGKLVQTLNKIKWLPVQTVTVVPENNIRFSDPEKEKVFIDKKNVPFVIGCSAFAIILLTCLTKVYRFTMFRMYKHIDSDLFIGVVPRWFLWTKNFTFRPADIKRFPPSGYIRFVRGDVQIKGRPFVLDFAEFALPKYYNEMVGYDVEASGRKFEEDVIIEKFKRRK
ncbi:Hypothetical predicted protein [Mytilus galloprovincialis]|uniref:Transmembrane protein n=1 Tax=Mytilus galloprovincialis TaxID=29158 RepID=A0A8B6CP27_MYTGA|nr:Hypothetical predicted protein [Mytilus galloprovincialis]